MLEASNLLPSDGEALYFPQLFSAEEADVLFRVLRSEIHWRHESIWLFGRKVLQPRLTAWYGDAPYRYSGLTMEPMPWTPVLLSIKDRIEPLAKVRFNGALLNCYRDGNDSMGWHRDDEKELGINPVIGSVSLGARRVFQFRHSSQNGLKASVELESGSFLLMRGVTQHHWQHALPKSKRVVDPRINITFRVILPK